MTHLKRLATERPIPFALLVAAMLWAAYLLSGVLAAIVSTDGYGHEVVEAGGRFVASIVLLNLLWRYGWWEAGGIARGGAWHAWGIALALTAYDIAIHLHAFFGQTNLHVSAPVLAGAVALNSVAAGLIEEVAFRGLALYALVRLWGDSKQGIWKSVVVSSLIFGGTHLLRIALGKPPPLAALLAVSATMGGFYEAAIVLHGKSIWPAVIWHGLLNAVVSVQALGTPGFEETVPAWMLILLLQLPAFALGALLLWRVQPRPVVPEAA